MDIIDWLGQDNPIGLKIFNKKYRYNNESFEKWLDRISNGNQEIRQLIIDKKFLFGGRILSNRGLAERKVTLSNCFEAGSKVLTINGYKNIEDIQKGELVLSHDGNWHIVNETMSRDYEGDIYELCGKDIMAPIHCTPNHTFLTLNGEWKAAKDLRIKSDGHHKIDRLISPNITISDNKTYEDEVFKYTVSDITPNITIYYGIFPYTGDVSTLSLAMLSAATSASFDKYPMTFVIPVGNGDNAMSEEELDNEAVNYVLVVPAKYDGKVTLIDQLNNSILSLFPVVKDVTIPDMTVYMRVDNTVLYKGSEMKTETYNITIG